MEIQSASPTQYIGQQVVHLDVRPKRAVFLFRTNSKSQFRDAVEHASSRWGGIQEPIIPVSAAGRIQPGWRQVVEQLDPDIAFDVAALDPAGQDAVAGQLGLPVLPVEMESRAFSGAHPLIVEQREGVAHASTSRAPSAVAGPGLLPTWDSAEHWAQAGLTVLPSEDPVDSAINQLRGTTLIEATGTQCGEVSMSALSHGFGLLWIAHPSSLRDAVWFWNMRALMPRFVSRARAAMVSPEVASEPAVGEAVQQFKDPRKWSTPDVLLLSLSIERERLAAMAASLGFEVLELGPLSFHLGRARSPTDSLTVMLNADPRTFLLSERQSGLRTATLATVEAPKTVIRVTSPVRFGVDVGGHVRARLSGPMLRVPHREPVARLFLAAGSWKQDGLETENDPTSEYSFSISVPSRESVLHSAVGATGLRFQLSPPGRLAAAVTTMFQPGERPFADPHMRSVVSALTTKRSKSLAQELADSVTGLPLNDAMMIADRIGPQLTQAFHPVSGIASGAEVPMAEAADRVERLVRLGLAERGLLVKCEQCTLRTFVTLQATMPMGTCPACKCNVTYAANQHGELQVHYRLNALLDRASNQGVIPHLAVLDQLAPDPQTSHFLLGADLFDGETHLGEVDLLGYDAEALLCGEVKTSAERFTPRQIKKTVYLAGRIKADVVVFGCTARIPPDLADLIATEAKSRRLAARVVDLHGVQPALQPEPSVADALPLPDSQS